MFTKTKSEAMLDDAIEGLFRDLEPMHPGSEEYDKTLSTIERLLKLKEKTPYRPSPDTVLLVASNLLGIAMIIRHENMNVITSKALGFVTKPR